MSIIRNEIPILEYDDSFQSVIMPDHEKLDMKLPEKCVFLFIRDMADDYARSHGAVQVGAFESATKLYPIWVVNYKGKEVCLCQAPVGAAPAAQILDWLCAYGVRKVIAGGCCGALEDIPENTVLVPVKALRDEGTSYHYQPPSRFMEVSPEAIKAIEATVKEAGLAYKECVTWSTDGFFRETAEKIAYRKSEGCSVVDMECSALAAVAKLRGFTLGAVFYTADTLSDPDNYDPRNWGENSRELCLKLCLESVIKL